MQVCNHEATLQAGIHYNHKLIHLCAHLYGLFHGYQACIVAIVIHVKGLYMQLSLRAVLIYCAYSRRMHLI